VTSAATAFALFGLMAAAQAQTITPIGTLSNYVSLSSKAEAINSNGTVVVGSNAIQGNGTRAIRWTLTGGIEDRSCAVESSFLALGGDGSIAVGAAQLTGSPPAVGVRWDVPGPCSTFVPQWPTSYAARALGVNPAGTIIVGSSDVLGFAYYALPWRWDQGIGYAMLAVPSGYNGGNGIAVSADSLVVVGDTGPVGFAGYYPVATYWDSAGAHPMGLMPNGMVSSAAAVNADGSVIVGSGDNGGGFLFSPGPMKAFRWTASGYEVLGLLPGAPPSGYSLGRAVSADGSVVVGEGSDPAGLRAFLWRSDLGMTRLDIFLAWLGVDLTGWSALTECHGISSDATALCGTGVYNGVAQGFIVRGLPKLCGPLIVGQTPNDTVCQGGVAVLNVSALTGSHPMYQWYQRFGSYPFYFSLPVSNGGGYSGATTPTLIISPVQAGHAGDYYCQIGFGCNTLNSDITHLDVVTGPNVTTQPPLDFVPCWKGAVNMSIAATTANGPIAYQWQYESPFMSNNWADLANGVTAVGAVTGAQTASLGISNFYLQAHTTYRCRLTDGCGTTYTFSTLIDPCFGDMNCDGVADFFDYLDFVNAYNDEDLAGDLNGDNVIDFFDYLDFVGELTAGC
jgi:uncharacterized membrane protein